MSLNEEWDWLQKKVGNLIQIQVLLQETVGMARTYTTSVTVINTNNMSYIETQHEYKFTKSFNYFHIHFLHLTEMYSTGCISNYSNSTWISAYDSITATVTVNNI